MARTRAGQTTIMTPETHAELTPQLEMNDGIIDSIQRFAGDSPPHDDLTLVTVKRI